MKNKKIIILIALVLIAGAVFFGYKLLNKNTKRLVDSKSDLVISATDLVKKFETDEAAANKEFLGSKLDYVITVTGLVKEITKDETGAYTVILGDSTTRSSVRCSMDSLQNQEVASLKTGNPASIKGAITGFNTDDLGIGSDVVLNRCVVEAKK